MRIPRILETTARFEIKNMLLIACGVFICIYAISVLVFVSSTQDIGIHCAFSSVIKQVDRSFFIQSPEAQVPEVGDHLLQLGPFQIKEAPSDSRKANLIQVLLLKVLATIQDEESIIDPTTIRRDASTGAKQVLIRFEKANDGTVHTIWCPIRTIPLRELGPSILWFSLKLGLFFVGALVLWKRPEEAFSVQFFLLCIVTVGAYMGGYHWARIATQPMLLLTFIVCGVLLPPVSLHFYLVFPRPKPVYTRQPVRCISAIYGPPLVFLVAILVSYLHLRGAVRSGLLEHTSSSLADEAFASAWTVLRTLVVVYLWLAAALYLASVTALLHSYRYARDNTERNQVKWILYGAMLAVLPIGYTLYLVIYVTDDFGVGAATWPMFAASASLTIAYAVSITRYRLMQLDQIVSSGVVYFLVSFLAGLVYYAVVFAGVLAADLVGSKVVSGPSFSQTIWVSASFLVLMLILDMARSKFRRALDRRFYREKHQIDRTLRRMGQAIEQLVDPPTLARSLLQASADMLNVTWGAVYLREGTPPIYKMAGCLGKAPALTELSHGCPLVEATSRSGVVVAQASADATLEPANRQLRFIGGEVSQALAHEGQLLALLILGSKPLGKYGADDLNLLTAFAQLTALALESAEGHRTIEALNQELRDKVEKIAEQQRRILALQSQLTRQLSRDSTAAAGGESAVNETTADTTQHARIGSPLHTGGFVGSSVAVRQLLELVRKVSATQSAVLIRGESGTGKGVLSRLLHQNSARAAHPFVEVHCAALSPALLESELFGHVKGAYTGAHRDKIGRFESANGGTLFLDEIGDINLEVQTKLLRVLQEKKFERVGSSEPIQVDVRIIAATHQNLETLIHEGRFREDLFFRLKVIDIQVPPLRERQEDIPELAMHFLQALSLKCGKAVSQIDDDAMAMLKAYRWRGNIRELENVMESAVVMAEGSTITATELTAEVRQAYYVEEMQPDTEETEACVSVTDTPVGIHAERVERDRRDRERLVRALAAAQGNKAHAARLLGMKRSTLVSRLKRHGLS